VQIYSKPHLYSKPHFEEVKILCRTLKLGATTLHLIHTRIVKSLHKKWKINRISPWERISYGLEKSRLYQRHVDNSGASQSLCCCLIESLQQMTPTTDLGMVTMEISTCIQFHTFMSGIPSSSFSSHSFLRQIGLIGKVWKSWRSKEHQWV